MPDFSSVQIPKPVDWQPFQRGCVPLFRKLIGDPSLVEYGRSGQDQQGIDLIGYRAGDLARPVGVQCRAVQTLKFKAIKQAVDQARLITPALTEFIIATTAGHDANLQREAMKLTAELVAGGWNCRVTIMGWETLQAEIATCPEALRLFWPVSASEPLRSESMEIFAEIQAQTDRVIETIKISRHSRLDAPLDPTFPEEALAERRDVHERISVFRDLLSDGKTATAIRQLEQLRGSTLVLEPYARYRIEVNLGAAHLRAGRPHQALTQWRSALEMRPDDPKARANVALGLLATGDDAGARKLARSVLRGHPTQSVALSVLVQTSANDHNVDPLAIVPEAVRHESDVLSSIIAVLRKRNDTRWHVEAHKAAEQYPKDLRFRQWSAEATLEPILSDPGLHFGKPIDSGVIATIETATTILVGVWEKMSEEEEAFSDPIVALAQNCAAALRFCHRTDEAAAVIDRALARVGRHAALLLVRAQLYLEEGQNEQALKVIGSIPNDPQLALLHAELLARSDAGSAAAAIDAIAIKELATPLARSATKLRLNLALDLDDLARAESLVDELEPLGESAVGLLLIRAQIAQKRAPSGIMVENEEDGAEQFPIPALSTAATSLAQSLESDTQADFLVRVEGAQFLGSLGAHEAASNALHGRVDLTRDTLALRVYLAASMSAGLMVRARDALTAIPTSVSTLPYYRKAAAMLHWSTGDARSATRLVAELRELEPQRLDILLWYVDCLIRLGCEPEIKALLASVDDDQLEGPLDAKIRLARALVTFGEYDRALRCAYHVFLANRDTPQAWMGLIAVVLGLPAGDRPDLLREFADEEAVVEIESREKLRYSIEADEKLRHYTLDAIDVTHPIAMAVRGLRAGDKFIHPSGGNATILSVKNKYLEAFHTALSRYNDRFPSAGGLRRVEVDFKEPNGLDEMKSILASRAIHVTEEATRYEKGQITLGVLAFATGVYPVEAMLGLSELGLAFRVAHGFHEEREAALEAIGRNKRRGCVVDGPTLHIIRRLSLESIVTAICGPIGVAQGTIDTIRERLLVVDERRTQRAGTLAYVGGELRMSDTSSEAITSLRETLRSDIEWLDNNASVLPALPKFEPPQSVRRMNQLVGVRLFDDIFAASGAERLFLAEDLLTRQLAAEMGAPGTWLQPVLMLARERDLISIPDYARSLCYLSEIGETFLSVDGGVLLAAHKLDVEAGEAAPGRHLGGVMSCIGGAKADARSHADAVAGFLAALWREGSLSAQREPITGAALRQLLRERILDYREILQYLTWKLGRNGGLVEYLHGWRVGHFMT